MLSSDGKLFAASSETGLGKAPNLWDTYTGDKIASDPSKTYSGIGPSPDVLSSTGLLANVDQATAPKTAVIWNLRTGKELARLNSPDGRPLKSVAVSPYGSPVATSDIKGTAYVWDTATGRLVSTLSVPKHELDIVALSPDGRLAAGGSIGDNTINVWDATTGKLIAAVTDPDGHRATGLTFNAGNTELAVTDANVNVNVWKISRLRDAR